MENWQFGEGARDVCDDVHSVLSLFLEYMELGRVFLILWCEILQCSPYSRWLAYAGDDGGKG
jgi:hypothetical protein